MIKLTLGSTVAANGSIQFSINLMNPTSLTISSSDLLIEVYTSSTIVAKSYPLASTTKTFTCNSGCKSCTNIYNYCTECNDSYELVSNLCIPSPTSITLNFGNNYKGSSDSYLD